MRHRTLLRVTGLLTVLLCACGPSISDTEVLGVYASNGCSSTVVDLRPDGSFVQTLWTRTREWQSRGGWQRTGSQQKPLIALTDFLVDDPRQPRKVQQSLTLIRINGRLALQSEGAVGCYLLKTP